MLESPVNPLFLSADEMIFDPPSESRSGMFKMLKSGLISVYFVFLRNLVSLVKSEYLQVVSGLPSQFTVMDLFSFSRSESPENWSSRLTGKL